jgi:hypothetical protein
VEFKANFQFHNSFEDEIRIDNLGVGDVELRCNECGAWIENTEYDIECKLEGLRQALDPAIGLPGILETKIQEDGKVKTWLDELLNKKNEEK